MPEIIIHTCDKTPNFEALEVVMKQMLKNYETRTYQEERQIQSKSGRVYRVRELPHDNVKSICSCAFNVKKINER